VCTRPSNQTSPRQCRYEVTLKFLVAAYTFVFAGPSHKAFHCLDTHTVVFDE
jgi:hypothetical protein